MSLYPGLRFQILLILAALAALATFLSTIVALAVFDRAEEAHRTRAAKIVADTAGALISERCDDLDLECAETVFEELPSSGPWRPRLVDVGTRGAAPVRGVPGELGLVPTRPEGSPLRSLLVAFAGLNFLVVTVLGGMALLRAVVRPVESLAGQVDRVGRLELGPPEAGHQLGQLGTSFRRMVGALAEERDRVERQIRELETANASLKEAQESLVRSEKLATVGRLAAGLAHEIGNPLGGLMGYLGLLRSRLGGDPKIEELLHGALASCHRIDRAIRDLLDFARPGEPKRAPFDLVKSIEDAVRLVKPRLREARVDIDSAADRTTALGDRGGMVQVLVNLIMNSLDAMEGQGRVLVSVRSEGAHVIVAVEDEGPGLPKGAEAEVFEPFFTTKAPGSGTGLGLAISRRIVESFGGRMEAANRAEGGAKFDVWLEGVDG